ncbi:MAG: gliding motility protein GldN [Janthinobacterium lividum]
MTRYFKVVPVTAAAMFLALAGHAQEQAAAVASTGAVRPIPVSDQMFKKTIWRAIDLREKQNRPMFSDGHEISRVIIEAVKRGELTPYRGDSVTSTITAKEMSANMSYPVEAAISPDADGGDWGAGAPPATKKKAAANDGWGSSSSSSGGWGAPVASSAPKRTPRLGANGKPMKDKRGRVIYQTVAATPAPMAPPPATSAEYRPKDIYQMELTEEMIFDKKRSRMYHQIKTVSLKLPSTLKSNAAGIEKNVASFKYADLVKVFRNNPQTAIWFNSQNDAQHKNLADAFELWLFNSYIVKVSNPEGNDLASQYGSERDGLLASQQISADLVEYEYNLWSF